ncbi:MAG: RDD family protein [Blastocatellia bacterium]|nr:RDD family protein [Blastocatellia bacterium]
MMQATRERGESSATRSTVQGGRGRKPNYNYVTLASLGLRIGAFLIDYILTMLILAIPLVIAVYLKRRLEAVTAANVVVTIGYLAAAGALVFNLIFSCAKNGKSFGKTFIGLRVVRLDGKPMDYQTALARHLIGYPVSLICFGLGFLWMFWDGKQQGWHDKLAKTIVVKD